MTTDTREGLFYRDRRGRIVYYDGTEVRMMALFNYEGPIPPLPWVCDCTMCRLHR